MARPPAGAAALLLRLGCVALLGWIGYIHLHLWLEGYRQIPTDGPLFLLNAVAGFVLAAGLLVWAAPLAGLLAAGYTAATLAALLISLTVGLFGFRESISASYVAQSLTIEPITVLALLAWTVLVTPTPRPPDLPPAAGEPNQKGRTPMHHTTPRPGHARLAARWAHRRTAAGERIHLPRRGWLIPAAVVATALLVAACEGSSPGPGRAGSALKTSTIHGATVLTNARGFTLYSFAPDTPARSNCNGQCAKLWPPVKGPVTGSGIKGTFGTIKRSDGSTQATFDGHPLYTYVGDKSPGQATGNGLNAAGGVWHEVTTSGTAAPAGNSPPAGGGYGY